MLVDAELGLLLPAKDEEGEQAASYQVGTTRAQEQEEAENARLLYVALTRAEQMLLVNGTVTLPKSGGISARGWLGQLVEITGIMVADLSGYDEAGDGVYTFDYTLPETAVRATIYEPQVIFPPVLPVMPEEEPEGERSSRPPLQEPLIPNAQLATAEAETPQRVWRVIPTARRPEAPAWVIGSLVHNALAMWRFPESNFDEWVLARAREYGLTDPQQLHHARTETTRLLRRFQQHALFREIEAAAPRLHEVPYSYEHHGRLETGYIDLLYQHKAIWTLVDFKTDWVPDEGYLQRLLDGKDYVQQVQQYRTAVQHLLGITPRLVLCFLNFAQEICVIDDMTIHD
jgi:ATP-dependent exoDNAse (exonuclease V) beta subunit